MRGQVLVLATAQALLNIAAVIVMTVGGLAGARIAGSPRWATMPVATMFLGTAVITFPASLWMARVGRRTGFIAGAALGVAGGLLAALGIVRASLGLLSAGTFLIGGYQGFAQFYRFAASEVADDAYRSRAISLVLAGGVVAAIAGPLLAQVGGPLLHPDYLGSFLILALVTLLAAGVLTALRDPESEPTEAARARAPGGRPWLAIVRQPAYGVALFGAATGYGIMILAMTATPIAMIQHGHTLAAAAFVIQLHVLGMFLPSFVTGTLIARFGVVPIMLAGVAGLLAHILLALTGTSLASFASALVALGVGWNFLYIGGTTLLTRTYEPAEKGRAQAINDMTIFVVGLFCSLSAGGLLQAVGWEAMNLVLVPWLAVAALVLVGFGLRLRTARTVAR